MSVSWNSGVANGILFANKLKTLPEQLSPSLKIIKNSLLEDLQISEKDFNFDPTFKLDLIFN